ncbi:MAG: HVO_0476 family zinc finger protein [Thermoplasmata archaeon]
MTAPAGAPPPEGDDPDGAPSPPGLAALHSAEIWCEVCGRRTPHRIVHLPRQGPGLPRSLSGVARCRRCGSVHPFRVPRAEPPLALPVVLSDGPRSSRVSVDLSPGTPLRVGEVLPGLRPRAIVRAIERADRRRIPMARADAVATVWAEVDTGPVLRIAIVEGRTTRSARLPLPGGSEVEVGQRVRVGGVEIVLERIRARGHTHDRPGERFAIEEVERAYGRRIVIPPAGRRAWSAGRERPVSRASSRSRSGRSRSSPGERR